MFFGNKTEKASKPISSITIFPSCMYYSSTYAHLGHIYRYLKVFLMIIWKEVGSIQIMQLPNTRKT